MTIDERIEALTQTVELLAHSTVRLEEAQQKTQVMLADVAQQLQTLATIAGIHHDTLGEHQRRMDRLEGK